MPFNKEQFVEQVVKAFFDMSADKDSQGFLTSILDELDEDTKKKVQIVADPIDDQYGILTLKCTLKGDSTPIEFRLKKTTAYGGPKTEHYIDRIKSKKDAFVRMLEDVDLDSDKRFDLEARAEALFIQYQHWLLTDCALNPNLIKTMLRENKQGANHFYQQHEKAKVYLALFMNDLCAMVQESHGLKPKAAKAALYRVERDLMSGPRPERITARKLHARTRFNEELIEISTTTPVNKARTVSSAKKDEPGVANWLFSKSSVYTRDKQGKLSKAYDQSAYRSASIVPHELFKQDDFSAKLARETAKRNLLEHIIPHLVAKTPNQKEPIQINYEMLTLLSPISKLADMKFDPDHAQFMAIKAAFNQYQGRKFYVSMPDGSRKLVQFNAIFHNYGVNAARGFKTEESANIRAFNQILERSVKALRGFEPFKSLLDQMPQYEPEETATRVKNLHKLLANHYKSIDTNNRKMTSTQHQRLLELNAKRLSHELIDPLEKMEFNTLSALFEEIQARNRILMEDAQLYEDDLLQYETHLAQKRKDYFIKHMPEIEAQLAALESTRSSRTRTEHMRALSEYIKLVVNGHDKFALLKKYTSNDIEAMNRVNYEIHSYIEMLSKKCGYTLHFTCKSGKDRTNSTIEKQKAKQLVTFIDGRVPTHDNTIVRQRERILFDDGLLVGPGNDICGDNMKPAAQQLEQVALPSNINVDILREVSILQKGIDKLKIRKEVLQKMSAAIKAKSQYDKQKRQSHTFQFDRIKKIPIAMSSKVISGFKNKNRPAK